MSRDIYLDIVKAAKLRERSIREWLRIVARDEARRQIADTPSLPSERKEQP